MITPRLIRLFDILLAGGALIVLSPLLLGTAAILRLTGEGEVFYIQQRVGRGGKLFGIVKFATMLKSSPSMASGEITVHNDPRVLPVGSILRKYKINELPQLWNILTGDMSIIGPRPQTQRCFAAFPKESHEALTSVRPGLSSIGSILFRDEEIMSRDADDPVYQYDHVIMPYKAAAELAYIRQPSLSYYFLAIAMTVWVILRPGSRAVLKAFPKVPPPPAELAAYF